jgi:hypothetical protein
MYIVQLAQFRNGRPSAVKLYIGFNLTVFDGLSNNNKIT